MSDSFEDHYTIVARPAFRLGKARGIVVRLFRALDCRRYESVCHVDLGPEITLRVMAPPSEVEPILGHIDRMIPVGAGTITISRPGESEFHETSAIPFLVGAQLWCRLGADAHSHASKAPSSFTREPLEKWLLQESPVYRKYPRREVFWDIAHRTVQGVASSPIGLFRKFFAPNPMAVVNETVEHRI